MIVLSTIFVLLCLFRQSVVMSEDGQIIGAEGLSGIYTYRHQTLCGRHNLKSPPREFTGPKSPKLTYYLLNKDGTISLVASTIDVSEETAVLPAALFCVQSFTAELHRKLGEFICVTDPNDWGDDCVKTHCIVEESPGQITFDCDVGVKKGNYLDAKCENGRLTSPIESPGRRRTISYYMYNNPKEFRFNGKHTGAPRTDSEARAFQSLLCVQGPASDRRNDAPHEHWVCVREMTQWPACITHYCQFEEEQDLSQEYVYVARCGRTAAGALSKTCYEGRYLPALPKQRTITGPFNYFMPGQGRGYVVYPDDKRTPLPGFLYCLLGPLPSEVNTKPKFHWVCREDPNAWDKCVGTVCTFKHVGKAIQVECRNVRQLQRGNLINPHCDSGRMVVPALHTDLDTFKYAIYNEDNIYQVNADSEDLSYQSLLCVLGPYPGKPHWGAHSLWVCTYDPKVWPTCIDHHCRFVRQYKFLSVFNSYTLRVDCGYKTLEVLDPNCYQGRFHMPLASQFANTKTFDYWDFDFDGGKELKSLNAATATLPPYLWCVRGPVPGRPASDKDSVWNCVSDLERGFKACITSACQIQIVLNHKDEREFQYNCGTPTVDHRKNLIDSKCENDRIFVPSYSSPFDSFSFVVVWDDLNGTPTTDTKGVGKDGLIGYCVLISKNARPPRNQWFCVKNILDFPTALPCVKFVCSVHRINIYGKTRYRYSCGTAEG
ncbi:hypothetical protein BCR37DRAFT_387418 [Protomyces lactucae-debilis]|uniref:Uncharacterized protein n=1 Tax=Protomyces lactucae-debilis TaxID=2754530 RepID=A0A1Y2FDC3_PROLT|nr:uncharacterized protein BCR37DRAFT_387418 [Protomyces lactucae-debilis]ORY81923.1 hypothetical protein BCR37DRAFT_387418 [Protomyces lactucae-debilis]